MAVERREDGVGLDEVEHFTVSVRGEPGRARFLLRGELDLAAIPVLRARVDAMWGDARHRPAFFLLDLAELSYCDSSGVRQLLQIAAQCQRNGTSFRVLAPRPAVREVFEMTNTIELLNVEQHAFPGDRR